MNLNLNVKHMYTTKFVRNSYVSPKGRYTIAITENMDSLLSGKKVEIIDNYGLEDVVTTWVSTTEEIEYYVNNFICKCNEIITLDLSAAAQE